MTLTDLVNKRIKNAIAGVDKSEQLQSVIDPELNFRRNSINLYIGRRGSGKTFNVLRELIKLSQLPGKGGYNSFVYCTDKTNDNTVKELLQLVKLNVRVVTYANMPKFLSDLIDAKNAYQEVLDKGLTEDISDRCRDDLLKSLDLTEFTYSTPNTAVLYDDAINIFKLPKYKVLLDLLHQNRQPRITYFLCMQDGFSLPPQVKRNLDTCILFGGFNDMQMLSMLLRQLNSSAQSNPVLMKIYTSLTNREGLLFDYLPDQTVVRVLSE
jgi:Cdc6-like AAA superfamily ATPase